ncbi:MAG: IclR family transcriptional regulator [Chloroflexi bacterium]|nr:IclR family transcriptional regulator [Chloroflexota bacterium]
MTKNKPYPGTQAVLRAISILKIFTDERPEWGLAELTQEVGLNKTTTYRLLTALESEEMIARNPDTDTYRLGLGIITLGGYALRTHDLRAVCKPELEALAATAKETAALELLTGAETLVLDEATSERIMRVGQEIGARWPAHATSTGKAILAHLPIEEVEAILPQPLPAFTPHTLTDMDTFFNSLTQIRARGYAVANGEIELGYAAIGAPLFSYDGDVVAAISLAGPHIRLTADRIPELGRLICEAARRISAQLGHRPVK